MPNFTSAPARYAGEERPISVDDDYLTTVDGAMRLCHFLRDVELDGSAASDLLVDRELLKNEAGAIDLRPLRDAFEEAMAGGEDMAARQGIDVRDYVAVRQGVAVDVAFEETPPTVFGLALPASAR